MQKWEDRYLYIYLPKYIWGLKKVSSDSLHENSSKEFHFTILLYATLSLKAFSQKWYMLH
jgi:hypothetical protein